MGIQAEDKQPPYTVVMDVAYGLLEKGGPVPHPDRDPEQPGGAVQFLFQCRGLGPGNLVDRRLPPDEGVGLPRFAGPQRGYEPGERLLQKRRTEPDDLTVRKEVEEKRPHSGKRVRPAKIYKQNTDPVSPVLFQGQSIFPFRGSLRSIVTPVCMYCLYHGNGVFDRCFRKDAVAEIEDMAAGRISPEQNVFDPVLDMLF